MRLKVGRLHSRALLVVAAAVVIAVAVALWVRAKRASDGAERVLAAAPSDAWLILTLDVPAAWPLLEPLFGSGGPGGPGGPGGRLSGASSSACQTRRRPRRGGRERGQKPPAEAAVGDAGDAGDGPAPRP
jgi:hypothetical protein